MTKKKSETIVVDVAKLHELFVEWHTEDYLDDDEIEDYADRLLQRVRDETTSSG
jgi:hypothetical protein